MRIFTLLTVTLALLTSVTANALHVANKDAGIDVNTNKVSIVSGEINPESAAVFKQHLKDTADIPGDRIILINSPGGLVSSGFEMIEAMNEERANGTRMICIVLSDAHSMAFNLLTRCDVRLAFRSSLMLVHKIRIFVLFTGRPITAVILRDIASQMDSFDEENRQLNSCALGMGLEEYDFWTEMERMWTGEELYERRYLHGLIDA